MVAAQAVSATLNDFSDRSFGLCGPQAPRRSGRGRATRPACSGVQLQQAVARTRARRRRSASLPRHVQAADALIVKPRGAPEQAARASAWPAPWDAGRSPCPLLFCRLGRRASPRRVQCRRTPPPGGGVVQPVLAPGTTRDAVADQPVAIADAGSRSKARFNERSCPASRRHSGGPADVLRAARR